MSKESSFNVVMTGVDLEKNQNKHIAEWGVKHLENPKYHNEETNRTYYRRQRDRILYTGGFRRLQEKTQVMAATKNGDHRTRLTHALEVEQISISIADALGLNRDLVSAIALGHDIGHTPFGHAVERYLHNELSNIGGFSHAVQSIRYLDIRGVKLSNDVLEGILKHDTDVFAGGYDIRQHDCTKYYPSEAGNLESQAVYWADKLAYITHDFEDFYDTNIYKNAKEHDKELENKLKDILSKLILDEDKSRKIKDDINNFQTRDLIRNLLDNLIEESHRKIIKIKEEKNGKISPDIIKEETNKQVKRIIKCSQQNIRCCQQVDSKIKKDAYQRGLVINFDEDYYESYVALRKLLNKHYIGSPEVMKSDAKAVKIIESVYTTFVDKPQLLPLNIQNRIKEFNNTQGYNSEKDIVKRVVADYIASMTDKYAEDIYCDINAIGSYYNY